MIPRLFLAVLLALAAAACRTNGEPASPPAPPEPELADQLNPLIWYDIQSNALIGNGNTLLADWANARSSATETGNLHIKDMLCSGNTVRLECSYHLLRDGGDVTEGNDVIPDRLECRNVFRRKDEDDDWGIPRLPPKGSGAHSQLTIACHPDPKAS